MNVVVAMAVPTSPYHAPVKSECLPFKIGRMSAFPLVSKSLLYFVLIKNSRMTILQYWTTHILPTMEASWSVMVCLASSRDMAPNTTRRIALVPEIRRDIARMIVLDNDNTLNIS